MQQEVQLFSSYKIVACFQLWRPVRKHTRAAALSLAASPCFGSDLKAPSGQKMSIDHVIFRILQEKISSKYLIPKWRTCRSYTIYYILLYIFIISLQRSAITPHPPSQPVPWPATALWPFPTQRRQPPKRLRHPRAGAFVPWKGAMRHRKRTTAPCFMRQFENLGWRKKLGKFMIKTPCRSCRCSTAVDFPKQVGRIWWWETNENQQNWNIMGI